MSLETEVLSESEREDMHRIEQEDFDREPAAGGTVVEAPHIRVDGPAQLEMFVLGGHRPESASLRFTGMKVRLVDGKAFKKGQTIRFEGVAIVNEVAQKDAHDSETQEVVATEQRHSARIVELRVVGLDG